MIVRSQEKTKKNTKKKKKKKRRPPWVGLNSSAAFFSGSEVVQDSKKIPTILFAARDLAGKLSAGRRAR